MSDWELRKQRVHDEAARRVKWLVTQLRREGWDLAVVALTRVIVSDDGLEHCCRGASLLDADGHKVGPALRNEARNLRRLADILDQAHARGCYPEATTMNHQDVEVVLPTDRRPS